jgi:hypothetical protein
MAKPKGATKARKERRIKTAINLLTQFNLSSAEIVELLMKREEITKKTAYLAVKDAKKTLRGLGTQSTGEERGFLLSWLRDVFSLEWKSETPSPKVLKGLIDTGVGLIKTHPGLKGGVPDAATDNAAGNAVSSQLAELFKKLEADDSVEESENGSSSP